MSRLRRGGVGSNQYQTKPVAPPAATPIATAAAEAESASDPFEFISAEDVAWSFTNEARSWIAHGISRRDAHCWQTAFPNIPADELAVAAADYKSHKVRADTAVEWWRDFPEAERAVPWIEARTGPYPSRFWEPNRAREYDRVGVPPDFAHEWRTFSGREIVAYVVDKYTNYYQASRHYSDRQRWDPPLSAAVGPELGKGDLPGDQMIAATSSLIESTPQPSGSNTRRLPDWSTPATTAACAQWEAAGVRLPSRLLRDPFPEFARLANKAFHRQPLSIRFVTRDVDETFALSGRWRPQVAKQVRDRVNALTTQVAVDGGIILAWPTHPHIEGLSDQWEHTEFRRGWTGGLLQWDTAEYSNVHTPTRPQHDWTVMISPDKNTFEMPNSHNHQPSWAKKIPRRP